MELLKTRFLASHHGYFFPDGSNIPINSKGIPDADTFMLYLMNIGKYLIDNYNVNSLIYESPPEMKDIIYRRMLKYPLDHWIRKVKPKNPTLFVPALDEIISVEDRLQYAIRYYNECRKNIQDANKIVLNELNCVYISGKSNIIERIKSEVSATLNDEEIEAVIMYINPNEKTFRKNTLIALKVLNRFAKEQEIRFEDAVTVFDDSIKNI